MRNIAVKTSTLSSRTLSKEVFAMKTIKVVSCIFIALLLVTSSSVSQRKAGLTGAAFLKVGVGAQAIGMGSAVTAMAGDVNQLFWNPAGIALKEDKIQATFSYNRWIADLSHNAFGVTYNLEDVGTIGVGIIMFGVTGIAADRDIPTDPALAPFRVDPNSGSTYDYADLAVQVSFARYVIDNLSLGVTLKSVSQTIDGLSTSAFAVDFGSVYDIGVYDWTIAARFNNLGSDMKYYDIAFGLPLSFTVGTAISPFSLGDGKVTIAVDAVKPQDGPQYFFSGLQYHFMNMVFVRAGYKLNYSGTDDGGTTARDAIKSTIEGISVGAGFATSLAGYGVRLDYAYTQMDVLDAAHRVTLSLSMK
jgi:hypothetical protein